MCRYVFPWTIWRVPYLSSNQKLLQMQEYTHVLMQLRTGSPPYVPYDALVPHACKQVLNACPIETMNIVVLLLPPGQRLSTDKWPCHMEAPLVCTIHGANLIINIMPLAPFRPFAIPNENIRRCPRGQCYVTPAFSGVPNKGEQNQKSTPTLGVTMMHHATKRGFKDCPGFLNCTGRLGPKRGRKCYVTPAFSGVPNKGEQNQKSTPTLGVTMMHHATKRGFKDCPGFLNCTGRLGPKRGRKCYVTPAFSGVPNKGEQNQKSKPTLGVTMMHHVTKRGFKDCPLAAECCGNTSPRVKTILLFRFRTGCFFLSRPAAVRSPCWC